MSGGLSASNWYRVAGLSPRWRRHASIRRHTYRGVVWYVVEDRVANKAHRLDADAYRVVSQLDGRRTLQEIWDSLLLNPQDGSPSQTEILNLIGQLNAADLLIVEANVDTAEVLERHDKQRKQRWKARWANPLSIRVPLIDPDKPLTRLHSWLRDVPGWLFGAAWIAVILAALVQLPVHWAELTGNFSDRLIAADNLLMLSLVFAGLKLIHELAHGLALKSRGAEVHEMGVMLLLFYPVPYVDATSASSLTSKRDRILVSAAGMGAEVWIAAIAFLGWIAVEPGLLRSVLYNVVVVGSISTVVFNINPLLRFDGYYILADAIEVPNLGQRANGWWLYILRRYGFGNVEQRIPVATGGERRWFWLYAPAALAYKMLVSLTIAWIVAQQYFFIGVLLAVWTIWTSLVWPLLKGYGKLWNDPALSQRFWRTLAVSLGLPATLIVLLFLVPIPHHTRSHGVVALPEQATLRAGGNGFFVELLAKPGQQVRAGDLVATTVSPEITFARMAQVARLEEVQVQYEAQWGTNPARAAQLQAQVEREEAALARLDAQIQSLNVIARSEGTLLVEQPDDLVGRYIRHGDPIGYLVGVHTPLVRVLVQQHAADLVRNQTRSVQVRLPQAFGEALDGNLTRATPKATNELPSPVLSTKGAGDITLSPQQGDAVLALETHFEFEVTVDAPSSGMHLGSRVFVSFEHDPEPIGWRLWRTVRRELLTTLHL